VDSATTQYVLDLAATLPVVISDTEAVYLYGLDILARQQSERLYYMHDGLGSVRQLLDSTGDLETTYAYDPFGVPVVGGDVSFDDPHASIRPTEHASREGAGVGQESEGLKPSLRTRMLRYGLRPTQHAGRGGIAERPTRKASRAFLVCRGRLCLLI
jgi:hypothetical protein